MSTLYDIDQWGSIDSQGKIKENYEDDAIKSAMYMWLNSSQGDFILQPGVGGVVNKSLFRTLSDERAGDIAFTLQLAFNTSFSPTVKLTDLQVIPNYEDKRYEIYIEFVNPASNKRNQVVIYSKGTSEVVQVTYQTIMHTGENLYFFVLGVKPEQPSDRIVFNGDDGFYYYGKYKLVNMTQTDPYFQQILTAANG